MMKFKNLFWAVLTAAFIMPAAQAEHVTIIAVNDTHSQIDPASDGMGGALRRRAIYDKVRSENKYTMTLHAGDAVQGNVYFSLYGGAVEYAAIDSLGYDAVIWGNHEMDNGIDSTYYFYKNVKAEKLSANYDFSNTKMAGLVKPYMIKTFGDKRVAVMGINVCPEGIISEKNFKGLHYLRSIDVADATAKYLKEVQKVDYVVMLSHIGYITEAPGEPNDCDVIRSSHYIDLVIGGHSHTTV
ncbi:MAG: metallophosphoesterase, partial [Bacteroidales bacterium]|nr:metallophosphoesterase [Candidatus Sodaliphilus fimicaballi]